jgi:hypothetical protein
MARKLYYKIIDDGSNAISDAGWETVSRLQHWYNSEFVWTAGKLGLKMFAVFPNTENRSGTIDELSETIAARRRTLSSKGVPENEIVRILQHEGLIYAHKGGYFDSCVASGFTRVAGNEFNAYLVGEFLLKVSRCIADLSIDLYDEGNFVKPHEVRLRNGAAIVTVKDQSRRWYLESIVKNRHVFSVVDPGKYDNYPGFQPIVSDFKELSEEERSSILKNWNWLGFEENFDINGDDIQGYDLNRKVGSFQLEESP